MIENLLKGKKQFRISYFLFCISYLQKLIPNISPIINAIVVN